MPKPEPGTPGYKRRMADHADTGFTNWWGMDAPCKGGHHVGPILNRRYWEDFDIWIGECDACGSTVNPDQTEGNE